MRLGAVAGRVHVGPAGEYEPVDEVEHGVRVLDGGRVRRQQQGDAAGAVHGVDVGARQQERLLVPHPPLRPFERGAEPDDGPVRHRVQARRPVWALR